MTTPTDATMGPGEAEFTYGLIGSLSPDATSRRSADSVGNTVPKRHDLVVIVTCEPDDPEIIFEPYVVHICVSPSLQERDRFYLPGFLEMP